jgi:hypothetical protein
MKTMNFLVFGLIASFSAQAANEPFKLLKCPAVPQAYTQMITELSVLKTAIKRDAACSPVQSEVKSLESLLGARRTTVVELIKKNKTEPLQERELDEVRTYVEDVTKKVFATAELLDRNKNCFSEDNQALGLSDLASITLDATALAKTVAGPWSAPIAIGGQALAGIMQGLDKVVKSRRGYDFTKLEQRQSYVQSLCTYYNYRQDIENLLFPDQRVAQLRSLDFALKTGLNGMVQSCPECRQISELSKAPNQVPGNAGTINGLASSADAAYKLPLGSITVKTISSMGWVRGELNRIAEEMEGDVSIGRDLVSEIKADIDQFLFDKEAPRFIRFQNKKAADLFHDFRSYVVSEAGSLIYAAGDTISLPVNSVYNMNELEIINQVKSLKGPLAATKQTNLLSRIAEFERRTSDLLARTRLAMEVQATYCQFFQRAGLYNSGIQYACEGGSSVNLVEALKRLEQKPASVEMGLVGEEEQVDVVADWATGLTDMMNKLSGNPKLLEKK